jgi:23S rRNA U2552 (ribose-2'-O)-methylase RlmE/FtsJ
MTYFQLPKSCPDIYRYLQCIPDISANSTAKISESLEFYLSDIKERIKQHNIDWDNYKKYTNPYEYIHSYVPHTKRSIAKYKPLSRSYFKMIELLNIFHLDKINHSIRTFHLAEGPGGFIEALVYTRKRQDDKYIGMTLLDDHNDENIPAWKKSSHFLNTHKNIIIETGQDKTGNILSLHNFLFCKQKYESSMDIITADGGFDFSIDFNNQEKNMARLLFAQIAFALCLQAKNGSFILKVFDCFNESTIDLLYLLSAFYKKVYIVKPKTSRYANSEKYIVCKGFMYENTSLFFEYIKTTFISMLSIPKNIHIKRFFSNIEIPLHFLTKLEDCNSIFGQQQIENIHYTLYLIDIKSQTDKIDTIIQNNIQKCVQWCLTNNVQYNSGVSV